MRHIFLLVLLVSSTWVSYAQVNPDYDSTACQLEISTDPQAPYHPKYLPGTDVNTVPVHDQHLLNTFDWRAGNYPAVPCDAPMPTTLEFFRSPFFQDNNTPTARIAYGDTSDFHPEDGWELVKRDMGLLMRPGQMDYDFANDLENELRNFANDGCVYYVMLYNRHTSTLRLVASLNIFTPGQTIEVSLWQYTDAAASLALNTLPPSSPFNKSSGIMSQMTNSAVALDKFTEIDRFSSPALFPDQCGRFFYVDFSMAYDPCVCYFESQLNVTFILMESSVFTASGRSVGIARDLESKWQGGYSPGDYLASFTHDKASETYTAGAYIASEASKIYVDKMNEAEQKGNTFLAGALYFLATAAKVGAAIATKGLSAKATAVATPGGIAASAAVKGAAKGFTMSKALKTAAPVLDFLSGQFKEEKEADYPPMIIESELVLGGTVTTDFTLECAQINFATPGSKGADVLDDCCVPRLPDRPTYNNPLGVFALLKTPSVVIPAVPNEDGYYDVGIPCDGQLETQHDVYPRSVWQYQYQGDFQYAFNPSAKVNMARTKISAAFEIQPTIGDTSFISPYMSPDCLNNYTLQVESPPAFNSACRISYPFPTTILNDINAYIRILIEYEFDAIGRDGNPVTDVKMYRYKIDMTTVQSNSPGYLQSIVDMPPANVNYTPALLANATGAVDIYALNTITITTPVVLPLGVTGVRFIAGDNIELENNAHLPPGVELLTGYPWSCEVKPAPYDVGQIQDYCTSGQYKAKGVSVEKKARTPMDADITTEEEAPESNMPRRVLSQPLRAFPNPSTGTYTVEFSLDAPAAQVEAVVQDLTGRAVAQPFAAKQLEAGPQSFAVDIAAQPDGFYHLVLRIDGQPQTVKLVKQ